MTAQAAALVAGIIDRIEDRPIGTGRPPMPTIKVVETDAAILRPRGRAVARAAGHS